MPNNPIKRAAGQTVEEMAEQLAGSKEGNRLYTPKQGTYKEISDQLKSEALDNIIDQQLDLLATAKKRGRVDLNNVDEVEATATAYMMSCKQAGVYPTMLGFAAACGYSRKAIYDYFPPQWEICGIPGWPPQLLGGDHSPHGPFKTVLRKRLNLPAEKQRSGYGR